MLIAPKQARDLLADLTQDCEVPVHPDELTHASRGRFSEHGHLFIGDVAVRGYKYQGRWWFDDRDIRRAAHTLAQLDFDRSDVVDARLPDRPVNNMWSRRTDWRIAVRRWMSDAASRQVRGPGCSCGESCRQESLGDSGLPCGLTMEGFRRACRGNLIACTRPLDVLTWSGKRWTAPRAYVDLLDRWAKAAAAAAAAAQRCTDCGEAGDAWQWRTASARGWVTRCPSCTARACQRYRGQLHGTRYAAVPRRQRADAYLCRLCPEPRPAALWDHCHDHGYVRGPLCGSCNTHEGIGADFLARPGVLAHLLECRGCREQRTLPRSRRADVVRLKAPAPAAHVRCGRHLRITAVQERDDGPVVLLRECFGHRPPQRWEETVAADQVDAWAHTLVDAFVKGGG